MYLLLSLKDMLFKVEKLIQKDSVLLYQGQSHTDSDPDLDLPRDPKGESTNYFTSLFLSFSLAYVRLILYDWLLTAIHKTCSICYPNSFQLLTLYPLAYLLTFCCCPTSRHHSSLSAQFH